MRLFTCNKPVKWKTRCVNAASCYSFWNSCWGYNLHLKIHESLLIVFLFHINKTVDYNHLLCSRIWGFPTSTSYQFVKCFRHLEYFAVYTFKNITNQDFCLNLSYCFYSKTFSQGWSDILLLRMNILYWAFEGFLLLLWKSSSWFSESRCNHN